MIKKIALGTAQFGLDYGISNTRGQVPRGEVGEILATCLKHGIDTLDTASAYGNSEQILGTFTESSRFRIITKSQPDDITLVAVEKQLDQSLKLLNRDTIDGLLIHDFEAYRKFPEVFDSLYRCQQRGKVTKIGFSVYSPDQVELLLSRKLPFDLIQLPFNLLDTRFMYLFPELMNKKIEVHSRSTFLQGLFFLPRSKQESWFPEIKEQIASLTRICGEAHVPLHAVLLNYVLIQAAITRVIIGVESLDNLNENIKAVSYLPQVRTLKDQLNSLSISNENVLLPFNWKHTK